MQTHVDMQTFSQNMWIMGRDVRQDHENKVSRHSGTFMNNRKKLKTD